MAWNGYGCPQQGGVGPHGRCEILLLGVDTYQVLPSRGHVIRFVGVFRPETFDTR